ncbi:MAG: polysaccharide biosynthesis tyrosine autokinase [Planctomycetota bacterium]
MAQYELNLMDYWRIIRKRRWLALLIFAGVFAATWVYTSFQPLVFSTWASARYQEEKTMADLWREYLIYTPGDPMLTQAKVARSSDVIEIAATSLRLIVPAALPEDKIKIVASLQGYVSTRVEKDTNIIIIEVQHSDSKETAKIANVVVEAYIEYNLKEKTRKANNLIATLEERLANETLKLAESEDLLKKFKENNPEIMGIDDSVSINTRLEILKRERNKLLGNYTPRHPEVINLDQQIQNTTKELQFVQEKITRLKQLTREVEVHDVLYRDLKQKYESALLSKAEKVPDVSVVDRAVEPTVPVKPNKNLNRLAGLLIGLMLGLVSVFVVDHLDTSIGTIEEIENLLEVPVLGVIPHLEKTEPERKLFKKIFPGTKKETDLSASNKIRSQLVLNYSAISPIAEAYRILRTNVISEKINSLKKEQISAVVSEERDKRSETSLLTGRAGRNGKIILITSTGPSEGKTLTATNLAITMAQKGEQILLVDVDMRKALLYKIFGLDKGPGLSDILMGTNKLDEVTRNITDTLMGGMDWDMLLKTPGIDNLHIITAGSTVVTSSELLGSRETAALWSQLRARYDYIILDCPPVLPVTDVLVIGPHVDSTILIYRAGRTAKGALLRAKNQLTNVGIPVKGVVLNYMTPEIEVSSSYYYRYYNKYYSAAEKEK